MASDQETSERFPVGPQTPAARREGRTAPEREPQPRPGDISVRRLPEAPRTPPPRGRERVSALVALGSALGVVVFLVVSLGSSSRFLGASGFEAAPSTRVVAPGGWITLTGSDAPESTPLVLEVRSKSGEWREAGRAVSDSDGGFALKGRVLARPGPVTVRARAPEAGVASSASATVRPLRLTSVGDINLGDVPGQAIAAEGPAWPWESAGRRLRAADIAFGNLESPVSERGEPFPKQFNFRGTPAALAGLRRHAGMDVLNLANNHVGDYGQDAMLDTVRGVEHLGMKAVGAGADLRRALAPQVIERLGLRVAFVGFSNIAPIEFAATEDQPGTAWATPEAIAAAVRAARRRADIVVATFHWGIEKQTLESADQRAVAQIAVDNGAQIVIGAHPHTLQPVRRQGPGLIAFSLGNFVFGAQSTDTSTTGMLELDLSADGVTGARWRAGRIEGGRPVLYDSRPRRLPLRDDLQMSTGVNLATLGPGT
jgi:hypothetical protein